MTLALAIVLTVLTHAAPSNVIGQPGTPADRPVNVSARAGRGAADRALGTALGMGPVFWSMAAFLVSGAGFAWLQVK